MFEFHLHPMGKKKSQQPKPLEYWSLPKSTFGGDYLEWFPEVESVKWAPPFAPGSHALAILSEKYNCR